MTLTLRRNPLPLVLFFLAVALFYARPAHAQVGLCKAGSQCRVSSLSVPNAPASGGLAMCIAGAGDGFTWGMPAANQLSLYGGSSAARCAGPAATPLMTWNDSTGSTTVGYPFVSTVASGGNAHVMNQGAKVCLTASCDQYVSGSTAANVKIQAQAGSAFIDVGNASVVNASPALTSAGTIVATTSITANTFLRTFGVTNPTTLPAPAASGVGTLDLDRAVNRVWFSDALTWRDLQSGAHPVLDKEMFAARVGLESAGCLLVTDPAPDASGTPLAVTVTCSDASPASTFADARNFRRSTTAATTGTQETVVTTALTELRALPRMCASVYVPATIKQRFWVCLGANTPTSASLTLPASDICFRYSDGNADVNWQLSTSDGTPTTSTTSTGIPVTAAHSYVLCADARASGTVYATAVDLTAGTEARISKTTNLPATGTGLKFIHVAESELNTAGDFGLSAFSVETN